MKGLAICIQEPSPLRNEMINTPDFWSLLQSLKGHSEVAPNVFELITKAVTSQPSSVNADNYEATVSLLNSFATAGSVGAVIEQKKDRNARRSKPTRASKPRSEYLSFSLRLQIADVLQGERGYRSRLQSRHHDLPTDGSRAKSN